MISIDKFTSVRAGCCMIDILFISMVCRVCVIMCLHFTQVNVLQRFSGRMLTASMYTTDSQLNKILTAYY